MTVGPRLADDIVIRERIPTDDKAIRRLNDDAFGGTYESQLVADLRTEGLSAIELVSVDGTDVIGHILMSTLDIRVGDKCLCSLALAPMSVQPGRQRQGIGSALVREGETVVPIGEVVAIARDTARVAYRGHLDLAW